MSIDDVKFYLGGTVHQFNFQCLSKKCSVKYQFSLWSSIYFFKKNHRWRFRVLLELIMEPIISYL